jgi:hypothetical protein
MTLRLFIIRIFWAIARRIEIVASKIQDTALGWCEALEDEYCRLEDDE